MKKYRIKSDKRIGQPLVGSVCYFTLGVGYHTSGFMRVLFSDGQMVVGTVVEGEGASNALNYGRTVSAGTSLYEFYPAEEVAE